MLREKEKAFRYLFILSDLTIAIVSFQIGIVLRKFLPYGGDFTGFNLSYYTLISIIAGMSQVWVFRSTKFYHTRRGEKFSKEVLEIIQGVILNFIFIIVLLFFFRDFSYSRLVFIYSFIVSIINLTILHGFLRYFLQKFRAKGKNVRHIIIVGEHRLGIELANKILASPELGYRIYGIVEKDQKGSIIIKELSSSNKNALFQGKGVKRKKILQPKVPKLSWKKFEEAINTWNVDAVILAIPPYKEYIFFQVMNLCQKENIDVRIIPTEIGLLGLPWHIENFFDFPIINFGKTPLDSTGARNTKRIFDLIMSVIILTLFLPVFLLITVIIKISSEGSIFFLQERMGLDNKLFKMIKFRTMRVQAKSDSDTIWTIENDSRTTKFGHFLRRINLDELPQFINVFLGQMSIVGPRPERPYFVKRFKEEISGYMLRHKVKAGITGWAQVNGLRGDTSIEKRVEADIWYIENWTLWLDIKICILTVFKSVADKNAY